MYYHKSSHKGHAGFPLFLVIIGFFLLSGKLPYFFIWIFGFMAVKWLFVFLNSGQSTDAIRPSREPYISRRKSRSSGSSKVNVSFIDEVPEHEKPENFTREKAYCYECGQKVDSIARFCSFCGTSLL